MSIATDMGPLVTETYVYQELPSHELLVVRNESTREFLTTEGSFSAEISDARVFSYLSRGRIAAFSFKEDQEPLRLCYFPTAYQTLDAVKRDGEQALSHCQEVAAYVVVKPENTVTFKYAVGADPVSDGLWSNSPSDAAGYYSRQEATVKAQRCGGQVGVFYGYYLPRDVPPEAKLEILQDNEHR